MDGKRHRVPVEGDRRGGLSGTYIGHVDGYPAGYVHNFKTGEEIRWKASRPIRELTPAERAHLRVHTDAERAERESERQHREHRSVRRPDRLADRAFVGAGQQTRHLPHRNGLVGRRRANAWRGPRQLLFVPLRGKIPVQRGAVLALRLAPLLRPKRRCQGADRAPV
jgi:phage/plasmid primase-like uncharacterized protein